MAYRLRINSIGNCCEMLFKKKYKVRIEVTLKCQRNF